MTRCCRAFLYVVIMLFATDLFAQTSLKPDPAITAKNPEVKIVFMKTVPIIYKEQYAMGKTTMLNPGGFSPPPGAKSKLIKMEPTYGKFLLLSIKGKVMHELRSDNEIFVLDQKNRKFAKAGYFKGQNGKYLKSFPPGGSEDYKIYFDIPDDFVPVKLMISKELPLINLPASN